MAIPNNEVKVMEQSKVSPPPGSVSKSSLPLTFFDLPWLLCRHMQRLYFYEFPFSTLHFLETLLPTFKHSLSVTLRHFFPFAANLICPPPPAKPFILFTDGDSVSLTVAESAADFNFLSANHPRPVRALHPFVPKLAPTRVEGDGTRLGPLLALQVTVFPNSGICIGVRFNHVAADGRAFHHFMKSWALVCKTGGDLTRLDRELGLPSHDRAAIKDPADGGVELALLNTWWSLSSTWDIGEDPVPPDDGLTDNVRSTFVLSQAQIERLTHRVKDQLSDDKQNSTPFYISSFVVICALMLVCLVKSEEIRESNSTDVDDDDDEPHYFIFVADCRSRLQFRLPTTYFGNCLALCYAQMKRNELLGENGIVAAVKAIGKEVAGLKNEALKEAEKWMAKWKEVVERWRHFTVAGSSKLGVYEADFGWGKPKKSESVHVDDSFAICFAESRDDIGGVEVGLALNRDRMSSFSAILEGSLMELV